MLSRGKRIAQSFAGPYFEMVATGVAAIALWAWPDGSSAQVLYRFVILNYFVLLLNLVPMLELDGYWILSDALRVPDLRPRSLAFMRRDLWAKLRHRERFSASEIGIGLYGTVGVLFTIFCLASAVFFWRRTFGGLVDRCRAPDPPASPPRSGAFRRGRWSRLRGLVELVRTGPDRRVVGARPGSGYNAAGGDRSAGLLDALPIFEDLSVEVLNDPPAGSFSVPGAGARRRWSARRNAPTPSTWCAGRLETWRPTPPGAGTGAYDRHAGELR